MANKFNFAAKIKKFQQVKRELPTILANEAVNHFKDSFNKGGFTNDSFSPWKRRSPRAPRNEGRAILVDTADLKRSIRKKQASFERTVIATDVVYARVHNEGLRAGRGAGFMMPKRKYMGRSKKLEVTMLKKIKSKTDTVFR